MGLSNKFDCFDYNKDVQTILNKFKADRDSATEVVTSNNTVTVFYRPSFFYRIRREVFKRLHPYAAKKCKRNFKRRKLRKG